MQEETKRNLRANLAREIDFDFALLDQQLGALELIPKHGAQQRRPSVLRATASQAPRSIMATKSTEYAGVLVRDRTAEHKLSTRRNARAPREADTSSDPQRSRQGNREHETHPAARIRVEFALHDEKLSDRRVALRARVVQRSQPVLSRHEQRVNRRAKRAASREAKQPVELLGRATGARRSQSSQARALTW